MNDAIDFIGGEMGAGAGTDLTFVNIVVMKDSFETGLRHAVRHGAPARRSRRRRSSGSGSRRCRRLQVSFEDPGVHRRRRVRSAGLRLPSLRLAAERHAGDARVDHARRPGRVPPAELRAEQRDPGHRRRRDAPTRRSTACRRCSATGSGATCRRRSSSRRPIRRGASIVVNKPDAVQTEVRVGHLGVRAQPPDYMALNLALRILGGEGANRLHQVLRTERGLTYGAKADMDTLLDERRLRGVDQHAVRGDGRSAAADRRRVLAAAARARQRARAVGREGVHDRAASR